MVHILSWCVYNFVRYALHPSLLCALCEDSLFFIQCIKWHCSKTVARSLKSVFYFICCIWPIHILLCVHWQMMETYSSVVAARSSLHCCPISWLTRTSASLILQQCPRQCDQFKLLLAKQVLLHPHSHTYWENR